MPDQPSKIVTGHAEFYRAAKGDETRYYPAANGRAQAMEFGESSNTVIVAGFAVYDMTISSTYAVGIYATVSEAEAYQTIKAPAKPESVFETKKLAADSMKRMRNHTITDR